MAGRRVRGAALALFLGGCVFIDDFERFGDARRGDGGASDAAVEPDADRPQGDGAVRDDASIGEPDGDAGDDPTPDSGSDRDAQTNSPDASSGPRDADTPRDDAGTNPPDAATPAPGCASTSVVPTLRCYPDRDGDSFPDLAVAPVRACDCPADTLAVANPDTRASDCWDDPATRGQEVFPGQATYFPIGYGAQARRFDYDCDQAETKEFGVVPATQCNGLLGLLCTSTKGFVRDTACGRTEDFTTCGANGLNCAANLSTKIQACR